MNKENNEGIAKYFSMVKFSHTIFALPFALFGFFLALNNRHFLLDWWLLALVVLCMVFARNAAMGFNRYIDREIDKNNPRTVVREIPSGKIVPTSALWFVIVNSLLFIMATFFINNLTFCLSPVALLIILGYSFTKRFTALCHIILGIGLSLAPIGAFLAVTGEFRMLPIIYSFVVLCWVSGFDIIYALQDYEFDKTHHLKSIPVLMGRRNALILSAILHIISASLVITGGIVSGFGLFYWIGSAIFIGLLLYQHFLIKPSDLSKVNLAFFTTNGFASAIFATFAILDFYF